MRNMKTVPYEDMFTLSAPSPKWVWNAQGQLVEVPAGQPAWDHDPVTGQSLGQLVEAIEKTTYCNTDISNNARSIYGSISEVPNPRIPGGGYYKSTCDTHGSPPGFRTDVNGRAKIGQTDSRYIIVSPGDFDQISLTIYGFESSTSIIFNFQTMDTEIGNSGDRVDPLIFESVGGELYLIGVTTPGNTDTYTLFGAQGSHVDGSPALVGESFFFALPQVISGTDLSSFIYNETTGNMVRSEDAMNANTSFAEQYDPAQGWMLIDYDRQGVSSGLNFSTTTLNANNADSIQIIDNEPRVLYGSSIVSRGFLSSVEGHHKVLFKWENGTIKIFGDGVLLDEAESPMPPAPVNCNFFRRADGAAPCNGHLFNFRMGDTISDDDAIERTTL